MCRYCSIIPSDVLKRLSEDPDLSKDTRQRLAETVKIDIEVRKLREQHRKITRAARAQAEDRGLATSLGLAPAVTVYDLKHGTTLPGAPVPNPGSSADATAKRTFVTTTGVANFYQQIFGRNSIDNAGMTIMSSIHYGSGYNNAFWNGAQMAYGDGDGQIFVDFTKGNDVIGHELTHGVTQHTLQLAYTGDAGGLNESCSDVFGSMFRQWQAGETVTQADWLIGHDIMGPQAIAKGYKCLRDMSNPANPAALAKQPTNYSQVTPNMDPHYSSGIPNFAFYKMAMAIGGHSWDIAGHIWYKSMTAYGPSPTLKMKPFADRQRQIAKTDWKNNAKIFQAVDQAWTAVGL